MGNANRTALFMTYYGLLKRIFSSSCGKAHQYIEWCTSVLFRATFGTEEEKIEVSADIMSIDVRNLRAVLDKSAAAVPCVYLFLLSTNTYKFGCTQDLKRRATEHVRQFGAKIELKNYCYIDPKYIFEAETSLKNLCYKLGEKLENEVVSIKDDDMKFIQDHFKFMSFYYLGFTAGLTARLEEERRRAADLETQLKLERANAENEALRQRMEILCLSKDLEIAKLQLKCSDM